MPKQFGLAVTGRPAEGPSLGAQAPAGLYASQQGGTLIEVIIATVILAILGAAIIGSINYGMFMLRLARENARATQVLLEKTEALRLYTWDQIMTNGILPSTFVAVYDPQSGTNNQGCIYSGTISNGAVPFASSYSPNMRQITIGLTWVTMGRINHNRSITTYIAKDGLQNYVY